MKNALIMVKICLAPALSAMTTPKQLNKSSNLEITRFLARSKMLQARRSPTEQRLLFSLDATASRQATWDRACHLQAQMFVATETLAGLSLQLCFYRGVDDFQALAWSSDSHAIAQSMLGVRCLGGYSQIAKVLRHALQEHRSQPVKALVFVGDAMEERAATLYELAGQLGLGKLPAFMFQEGKNPAVGKVFAEIARLSGGVHCQFNEHSEHQLRNLLTAVASYAAGGITALKQLEQQDPIVRKLLASLPKQ
jgi:hypothetical protein